MNKGEIKLLAGKDELNPYPAKIFSDKTIEFLDALSKRIRNNFRISNFPDVAAFGFFCRRANIAKQKEMAARREERLGRGILFHIAPSNVPINFAFSYVFGLLSGNSNIVRVSSKDFPQVTFLCDIINEIFNEKQFEEIASRTQIIAYPHNKEINDFFSALCQGRIIWGGDNTIETLRQSKIPKRCVEINFADRYSIGMISASFILNASGDEIKRVANGFYNDTYEMDQNSCSAPHLLFWEKEEVISKEKMELAKKRFWDAVYLEAKKYTLSDKKVSEKYAQLCSIAAHREKIKCYENLLYVVTLQNPIFHDSILKDSSLQEKQKLSDYRGKFGLFFEYELSDRKEIIPWIDEKVQTVAVAGINPSEIQQFVLREQLIGIDRIVPFGKTLDIGLIWDGYDIIGMLSRIVAIC